MLLSNLLVIAALALAKSALSGTPISACTPETVYVTVTPTSTSDNASTVISTCTVSEAHGTSSASTSSDELTTTIHVTTISTTKTTDTITTTMTRPESSSERFPSDFSFDEPTTTIKSTSLTTDTYTTTMTRPKSSDDVTTLKSTSFTTVGSGTMTMTESADEETTTIFTTQFLTSIFTVPRPSSLTGIHSSGWDASAPVATGGNTTYTTTTILATLTTKLFMTTTTATRPSVTLSSAPYPSNATSSGVIGSGTGMPMSTANVTTTATSLRTVVVSSASTSATPLTSMCPEIGDFGKFTLKWDDVPGWSPEDNNTYTFPPVWNPYHHLIFANGYGYVPPPNEPFKPVSAPHMAIFLPNQTTTALEHPHAGILPPGGIGAGPRASQSAWWFDVYSSYFACDTATEPCTIQAIGYQYKPNIKEEYPRVMQNFSIPACPKNFTTECELKKVDFEPGFRALSSIQFQAFFEGNSSRQVFVMDDLALGWANNTCEAGLMRLRKK